MKYIKRRPMREDARVINNIQAEILQSIINAAI